MNNLETHAESIDAAVFSGDLLEIDAERNMLKTYCERWLRAIKSHEDMEKEQA